MSTPMLSIKQAAAIVGIHWRTVYAHVVSGNLTAYKVGRQWRIKREDLDGWIKAVKK